MRPLYLIFVMILALNLRGMAQNNNQTETATFGGGCFWCTEAVFESVKGVTDVVSGYCGGTVKNPAYREVTTGTTGHAEVVQISFNPVVVSYRQLLQIFFATHDPTTLNRQGADVGTQYRSVIFYHSAQQKADAREIISLLTSERVFDAPIVTQLEAAMPFYKAEAYHQEYFQNNPSQPYCRVVINPKVAKFRKEFAEWLKQ